MRFWSNLWIYVLIIGAVLGIVMAVLSPYLPQKQKDKIKELSLTEKRIDDENRYVVYKNRFSLDFYIGYSLFVVVLETIAFVYHHFFGLVNRVGGGAFGMLVAIFAVMLMFGFFFIVLLLMIVEFEEEVICKKMEKNYMEQYGIVLLRDNGAQNLHD